MLGELEGNAEIVGLFLDYETFGEHHRQEDGIVEFLSELPSSVLSRSEWGFITPGEAVQRLNSVSELSVPRTSSWADTQRDISAWCGNEMQRSALAGIYDQRRLFGGRDIDSPALERVAETWRRLQTSDHFYYMSTKGGADGDVHSYFSPFESPYDAFIAYMNVLKDLAYRPKEIAEPGRLVANQ
jgi:alpha-amylase